MPPYLSFEELLNKIDPPYRAGCQKLLAENRELFQRVPGSTHNHQAWPGGYYDHIREVLNLAVVLYGQLNALRPLPFSLSEALLVLFLHDLEKPWAYQRDEAGEWQRKVHFQSKDEQQAFRLEKLKVYGLELTAEIENGLRYAEGEIGTYSNKRRTMSPLAAFCHSCDVISARLWYDYPQATGDEWLGAERTQGDAA